MEYTLLHELSVHNAPLRTAKYALHIGLRRSHLGYAHRISAGTSGANLVQYDSRVRTYYCRYNIIHTLDLLYTGY
jgi:hypothetical protein